jgi:phage tail sheath protein FI
MAFLVSPGVQVKETDLSNIIPAVATSIGGFVGDFKWGPVDEVVTVSSEANLIEQFGYPVSSTAYSNRTDWYSVANFLGYSNNVQLVRVVGSASYNASAAGDSDGATAADSDAQIKNANDFSTDQTGLSHSLYAKYPGALGNGIGIAVIDAAIDSDNFVGQKIVGNTTASQLFDTVPGTSTWGVKYDSDLKDEMHVVVYTTNETVTGTANEVLETYAYVSKAKNALDDNNGNNYFVNVINDASSWIWVQPNFNTSVDSESASSLYSIGETLTNLGEGKRFPFIGNGTDTTNTAKTFTLTSGSDAASVDGGKQTGWDLLGDPETVDVNLIITGDNSAVIQKYAIAKAEARKDAIAFASPSSAVATSNPTAKKIVNYFAGFNSTSYAVFDSGWKRQYDKYNDEFFDMPLNPDIAGVTARAEFLNDAWFSPAGLNRGFIQNVVKLYFNPDQAGRDELYKNRVNPVITQRGVGTILFGDKTALSRPSSFDRINVRRLFIVLEKAIATAAKFQLFEFNDDFTRANFVAAVEPFLGDVKSRRGMTDFRVVCDTSNNTPAVIDGNRFVADIYIKPSRSINFITLNFTSVRSGVSFDEVAGQ